MRNDGRDSVYIIISVGLFASACGLWPCDFWGRERQETGDTFDLGWWEGILLQAASCAVASVLHSQG